MLVTIRHRQEQGGFNGDRSDHYVDCRVDFSEEEKSIIATRRLGSQYSLVLPSAFPPGIGISSYGLGAGLLKFIGWAGLIIGGILTFSGFVHMSAVGPEGIFAAIFGLLMVGGGIGAFVLRSRQGALHTASFADQALSLAQLFATPVFTIHASTRDLADIYANDIRGQLALLKDGIMRHTELRPTETFEI